MSYLFLQNLIAKVKGIKWNVLWLRIRSLTRMELYLFGDNTFVVENINDTAIDVALDFQHISNVSKTLKLPEDADVGLVTM